MLGENAAMSFRRVLVALVAAAVLWPTAANGEAASPRSTASRGPDQDAGYFLGYPSPTYSWHKCTKTSSMATPTPLDPGVPGAGKGTKQNKVTWTLEQPSGAGAGYTLKWKVAKGWKICGAQVALRGYKADADADYAMEAGYTSKGTKGSTVTTGSETIQVKLSKQDCDEIGIDKKYAGTWSIGRSTTSPSSSRRSSAPAQGGRCGRRDRRVVRRHRAQRLVAPRRPPAAVGLALVGPQRRRRARPSR